MAEREAKEETGVGRVIGITRESGKGGRGMVDREWLQELKAGDEVFILQTHCTPELVTVSKVTKTQIIIDHGRYISRYRRDTGRKIGGSIWHFQALEKVTDAVKEQVAIAGLKREARAKLDRIAIPDDRATLEALIAALTPFMATKKPE